MSVPVVVTALLGVELRTVPSPVKVTLVTADVSTVPDVAGPVSVTPFGMVRVPVDVVIVSPFTVVGVIAPSVSEIAGVVVGVATVPDTPFAVVTDTLVTDPDPAALRQFPPVGVTHTNCPEELM